MTHSATCKRADVPSAHSQGARLLLIALAAVMLFHGGLLPFTHGNTYDAFIHMFFADSYNRSWFDHWEPRWYTGFATTSYPPGTHMAMAALMEIVPLRAAFVLTQMIGLLLLVIGVYRFSLLWVAPVPAGYAALGLALSSSISETVHLFGQLPTIFSLGVFLNGLPYVYRWIVAGGAGNLAASVIFAMATTAAHHVTTIFGGVLFIVPLALLALRAVSELSPRQTGLVAGLGRFIAPFGRGLFLAVLMIGAMVLTVFPYWSWSISDPITQVPIPHGSRENFIERPDLGFIFFVLPWGMLIFTLPYVVYKTVTTRLWPLGLSVLLSFVLGTGGTTPISRAILQGAFDILTLDRFTFWSTILILPFFGHMMHGLLSGRSGDVIRNAFGLGMHRALIGGLFASMSLIAVFAAILPTIQPTQPRFIDPQPIVRFMAEDEHDRWRYLTLGFGDQFAYLSAQTNAHSIDGNYHSARRLPDLTRFSVERLENAKYLGVPGLGSLRQFLVNADNYHLRYVFSNDEFYDPLLHFSGWTRLNRLSNGVTVWERQDVTPLPAFLPRREMSPVHSILWGVLPPTALCLAALIFLSGMVRRGFGLHTQELRPVLDSATAFTNLRRVRISVFSMAAVFTAGALALGLWLLLEVRRPAAPATVIAEYFDDLDFRDFESAYERLDPATRPELDDVLFNWRWRGGLLASYGALQDIRVTETARSDGLIDWSVEIDWLTSLSIQTEVLAIRTVERDGHWFLAPLSLRPLQAPLRMQRQADVAWNVMGRRQPRPETDLHRDRLDRPRIALDGARLVERDGRYSIVGALSNSDGDPAFVSIFGTLVAGNSPMVRQSSGVVSPQRMLPAETAGFRVDFDGVLSLEDAASRGEFDPMIHIPLEFEAPPEDALIEARAVVTGSDLYRGVALNGLTIDLVESGVAVEGLAVNSGTETATIVRVIALLYDEQGLPIWSETGFVDTNMYAGQSAPFQMMLPLRDTINVVADLDEEGFIVNGSHMQSDLAFPDYDDGTIAMPVGSGYSALRLHISSMTYDPLF